MVINLIIKKSNLDLIFIKEFYVKIKDKLKFYISKKWKKLQ